MPASKNTLSRYQVINACFLSKNKKYWSLADLLQSLEEHDLFVSSRTVELDLETMRHDTRLGYCAPIKYCALNRGYHYTDSTYSINGICLNREELQTLLTASDLMIPYRNIGMVRDFQAITGKVVGHINRQMLLPDLKPSPVPQIKCLDSIPDPIAELVNYFLMAIKQHIVLKVKQRGGEEFFFHPYSIYYKSLECWYIIGLREEDQMLIYREMDCIEAILFSEKPYKSFEETKKTMLGEA